ncbi:sigma-70 family RNA polymerase sigma factor [Streptomyces sp. B93]|nr:sigma-70 family RNA polymerase sigma factor [Streptomyces sp. B93]
MSVLQDHRVLPEHPEPVVITRARTGDREAFALLYREHHRVVHRYLAVRTRDRHLADDLAQDVFVRALRGIDGFAWQGKEFSAWLLTIARNLYLDEMGRSRSRLETPVAEFRDAEQPHCSTELLALRELEAVENRETVQDVLRVLNPPERHCLELRFFDGLSAEETAHAMGRSVGAVRALTHRAVRRLRWSAGAVPV